MPKSRQPAQSEAQHARTHIITLLEINLSDLFSVFRPFIYFYRNFCLCLRFAIELLLYGSAIALQRINHLSIFRLFVIFRVE